jgi:hypothetical protein
MAYARTYLKNYREKYGDAKKAYTGKNPEELKTWRKEKWVDVKSVLKDPKNPTVCGNAPVKPGEYPLCMPISQLGKYNKSELGLLVQRKNQIGKRRLVKDAYLRDVLEPEKITPIREYKDKYIKEKKHKLPEPLPKAQAEKILKERPIKKSDYEVLKEPKEPKAILSISEKKDLKNKRQREKYVSVRVPKEKVEKVSVPKPPKEPKQKVTLGPGPRPFSIVNQPVTLTFD